MIQIEAAPAASRAGNVASSNACTTLTARFDLLTVITVIRCPVPLIVWRAGVASNSASSQHHACAKPQLLELLPRDPDRSRAHCHQGRERP